MTMNHDGHSGRLIIVEGPDGAGKTGWAVRYAHETRSLYVHMGPFKGVSQEALGRFYAEAMMPAVLGTSDVVMDRCWLSEQPYGRAFRGGQDRVGVETRRLLERLALRCRTNVVLALPPIEVVRENFLRRHQRGEEMLLAVSQLNVVYAWYRENLLLRPRETTALPVIHYDYTTAPLEASRLEYVERGTRPHHISWATAGNSDARFVLVVDRDTGYHDHDTLYQWPNGSLSGGDASRWFARELESHGIGEEMLMWVDPKVPNPILREAVHGDRLVVALGPRSRAKLAEAGIEFTSFPHPRTWRHHRSSEPHPIIAFVDNQGDTGR